MARRSRRSSLRRRHNKTKRKQSGGGFFGFDGLKDAFKSLFTRKAAAQAQENPTFNVINPMAAARPMPVAQAAMQPSAALNNMTRRRQQSHFSNIKKRNNEAILRQKEENERQKEENERSYENAMRAGRNAINHQKSQIAAMNPTKIRRNFNRYQNQTSRVENILLQPFGPQMTDAKLDAELDEEFARLSQGGGGLTAAQIEAAVNSI